MADPAKSTKSTKTVITTVAHEPAAPQHLPPAPHQQMEEEGGIGKYCYNSEKHEILGRTLASWFFITVFYIIFFFCLFCFFVLSWYISLSVLDVNEPYRQGKGAILGHSGPGLTGRPIPDREYNGVSTLLWYKTGTYAEYQFWSVQLRSWFKHIPNEGQKKVKTCLEKVTLKTNATLLTETGTATKDESCLIDPYWYGTCNGVNDDTFGYNREEPCLLFKMNRIHGWAPVPFTMEEWKKAGESGNVKTENGETVEVPKALVKYITDLAKGGDGGRRKRQAASETGEEAGGDKGPADKGTEGTGTDGKAAAEGRQGTAEDSPIDIPKLISRYIMVWCEGEQDHDKEFMGSLEYFPGPYIPAAFFPFKGQTNYQTPFVMVHLKRTMPGAMISIVCQAFAKNINLDRESGIGHSRFQIMAG